MMIRTTLIFLLLFIAACGEKPADAKQAPVITERLTVLTSHYPLFFFASEIAGDHADIRLPEIDGDPAMWTPGPSAVPKLQNADLVIINGAGYESWLAYTTLPGGLLLDTTAGIQDQLITINDGPVHQHGPQGEHSHGSIAFTTWLDPRIAIAQATAISERLSQMLPGKAADFEARLENLVSRLSALDQSLANAFAPLQNQPLVFSHPVFQYLQRRYGLDGPSVHWEPDIEPGVKEWIDFQNLLRTQPAELMLWEGPPLDQTVGRLQKQGIHSIVFDPAASQPEKGDYFSIMDSNLDQLSSVRTQ